MSKESKKIFTTSLFLSLVIQFGYVIYISLYVPSPPKTTNIEMSDRFVAVIAESIKESVELELQIEDQQEQAVIEETYEIPDEEESSEQISDTNEPEDQNDSSQDEIKDETIILDGPSIESDDSIVSEVQDGESVTGTGSGELPSSGGPRASEESSRISRREHRREASNEATQQTTRVQEIEDTSVPPCAQAIRREPEIPYPLSLREQAIHGTISVQCIITPQGYIRACRLRAGEQLLFDVAKPIIEQWRCSPALDADGNQIAAPYTFRIPFNLED